MNKRQTKKANDIWKGSTAQRKQKRRINEFFRQHNRRFKSSSYIPPQKPRIRTMLRWCRYEAYRKYNRPRRARHE